MSSDRDNVVIEARREEAEAAAALAAPMEMGGEMSEDQVFGGAPVGGDE